MSSQGLSFRVLALIAFLLVMASYPACADDDVTDVPINLSQDEAATLKRIYNDDALIKAFTTAQKGLSDLNKALSLVTPGPIKLVLKWNDAAFKAWGNANKVLGQAQKIDTCSSLTLLDAENSPNADFFRKLESVRGCS